MAKNSSLTEKQRTEIVQQALAEIEIARTYKEGFIPAWHKNENMYYGKKEHAINVGDNRTGSQNNRESRANVELGKMQSFVHTVLSKIDTPLTFKYLKGSTADYKKAHLLNSLKDRDAHIGDWDWKDLVGKQQAVLYTRAIYCYSAGSPYRSYLENVDVYDFLIDPNAGGLDLDNAYHLGRWGVKKNKGQLEAGVKSGLYNKKEVAKLLTGSGDYGSSTTKEDINKENRFNNQASAGTRKKENKNIYVFWEWYTTYEGKRYYLLLQETGGTAIRIERLTDLFPEDEQVGDAMWPFWSWACFPNLTEFWSPSYADYVREIFMAQSATINQMLDNAERINKPQRAVNIDALEDVTDLVYRRNGVVRFKNGYDIKQAFQIVETPQIDTPLRVYDKLESIQSIESGVTADARGASEEERVGIYEGNLAQVADRFGLLNKSYSQGYRRFAKLYYYGVMQHLSKKVAIQILGPKGYEKTVFVNRKDLKPKVDYAVMVEASTAEMQTDATDRRNKIIFLGKYHGSQVVNQRVLFETEAEILGLDKEHVRALLDLEGEGTSEVLSEADRDIVDLLNKKYIEPNLVANTAYANRILEYMKDHREDMSEDQWMMFADYMERIEPLMIQNMGSQAVKKEGEMLDQQIAQGGGGEEGIPHPVVPPGDLSPNENTSRDIY